ncbi:hypothetical protein KAR91_09985 [Candidatus Pacearchaeota archaeon]|nr:hypothetical protein [Candidatus Pacearchaeota archaeon]
MPKKPVKIILKFSNDSTTSKGKKGKDSPKKSGPSDSDSARNHTGPKKLRP